MNSLSKRKPLVRVQRICACDCGTPFLVIPSSPKRFLNNSHARAVQGEYYREYGWRQAKVQTFPGKLAKFKEEQNASPKARRKKRKNPPV